MRKLVLTSEIAVYPDATALDAAAQDLLQRAKHAASTAYAPYSHFRVGAAALLENGQIVLGNNQENAAYPNTLCAERVAIFAAAALFPEQPIVRMAITVQTQRGDINRPVSPCGACRQSLYETETRYQRDIELILQGEGGEVYQIGSVKQILPLLFDATFL